jgi:hypothetical protein
MLKHKIHASCEFKEFAEEIKLWKLDMPGKTNLIFSKTMTVFGKARGGVMLSRFKVITVNNENAIGCSQKTIGIQSYLPKISCSKQSKLQTL